MATEKEQKDLDAFLSSWPEDQSDLKRAYLELIETVKSKPPAAWSFVSRPGISYSFRAQTSDSKTDRKRPVFFLMDVIPDPEGPFWLSVCFYEDEITDPDGKGNAIPNGLFQEAGYCFDMDDGDRETPAYLKQRIDEAYAAAIQ
ncbi:MAG: hypothetical protein HY788_23055 [Deltaproteobacteria bacterium]|nr:hypothetical protein [Deltaproteobacteria bacterium]